MLSEGSCQKVHVLIKRNECNMRKVAKLAYPDFVDNVLEKMVIARFTMAAMVSDLLTFTLESHRGSGLTCFLLPLPLTSRPKSHLFLRATSNRQSRTRVTWPKRLKVRSVVLGKGRKPSIARILGILLTTGRMHASREQKYWFQSDLKILSGINRQFLKIISAAVRDNF